MNTACCPSCGKPLPTAASFCALCEETLALPSPKAVHVRYKRLSSTYATVPMHYAPVAERAQADVYATVIDDEMTSPTITYLPAPTSLPFAHLDAHVPVARSIPSEPSSRLPETPSPGILPNVSRSLWDDEVYDNDEEFEDEDDTFLHGTWHKELDMPSPRLDSLPKPRPSSPQPIVLLDPQPRVQIRRQSAYHSPSPRPFFWVSLLVLALLLLGGFFGMFTALGLDGTNTPTLKLSATTLAVGESLTLNGVHFTPQARIGLSLDTSTPVNDTHGQSVIHADAQGNFSDTLLVVSNWQAGPHTMNAEDAVRHKVVRVSFFITGTGSPSGPAHFKLSTNTLNMGIGDSAMNSEQVITLTNSGGSQLSWQARSNSAWLLLSPTSGTLVSGQVAQVIIAVDRINVAPGSYAGQILFSSNAGNNLLTARMQVIPLNAQSGSVLAVTPAVLSFTGTDGANAPPAQNMTISNLGAQSLQWSVSSNQSWLTASPTSGSLQGVPSTNIPVLDYAAGHAPVNSASLAASQQIQGDTTRSVSVNVNTSTMLPGTYSGVLNFTSQGQSNNVQQVAVSLTIQPQCTIQVAPSVLTFATTYQQTTPASKAINVTTSQGCTSPVKWSVTSNASWLSVSNTSGSTPASPQVSVNVAGLTPGAYNSSLVFTTSSGTQTLPVNLTVGQTSTPTLSLNITTLNYNAVVGSSSPLAQVATVSNTGGGTLNWQASATTSVGGNWLTVSPTSGTLTGNQSDALSISATLLSTLVPGTYSGTVTLTGTDSAGHSIAGSTQTIQVSFIVVAPCAMTVLPTSLVFAGVVGQAVTPQAVTLTASGACADPLSWSVVSSNSWLVPTASTGTFTLANAGNVGVGVSLTGLKPGTYQATLTITTVDSVTKAAIAMPQQVAATLTVQTPCTLSAPSSTTASYVAESGQSGGTHTFSIGASGACAGGVLLSPVVSLSAGTGWLTVTPTSATIASGGSTTFSVTASAASLRAGTYTASIALSGLNSGTTVTGSPQVVGVTFTVSPAPVLSASPGTVSTHGSGGLTAQPVVVANTGGNTLNWTAKLGSSTPAFLALSATSGTLTAGANTSINLVSNTASPTSGTYTISVILSATDAATGGAVNGSPTTVAVTVTVAPPSMQVSTTSLSYRTNEGGNPAAQAVTITNGGGDTLSWHVGSFSAPWLSASPTSGSDMSGSSSPVSFSVDTASLAPGTYSETAVITPSVGQSVTLSISVTVVAVAPTPTPTATVGVTPGVTSTVTPTPTTGVTATATEGVTPTPDVTRTATPTSTATATTTKAGKLHSSFHHKA